jgi:phage gpG-like protein
MTYASNNKELMESLNIVLNQNLREEFDLDEILDYINVIKEYNINEQIKKIQKDIKNEKDIMKQVALIDKITELIKDREEL